ncbi:MAG: hypothetical protein QOJ94_1228 [Sphingomonadales bacterium]|jgi:tetratricopeptide (TPR) repeat protein|nr:hypothetical protein [Sphingomonadales bacterium]
MRRSGAILLLLAATLAATAAPAAEPADVAIGPPPAWIDRIAIPEPNPAMKDRPIQALLMTAEGRYSADGATEYFVETATLIQTPEGLAALGNIALPWNPAVADLVVNKVRILRAGREIDLLSGPHPFTVLRRENNLESAMLDGVLTAAMQPEGLVVGDILDVSFTLRLKPQPIAFRPEDMSILTHGLTIRRVHYRQLWQNGLDLRWAATDALGKPKVTKSAWGTELLLDLKDADAPEPPKDAPIRFQQPARVEITGYSDWADISRLVAPAFAAAQQLAPNSPLKAEIDNIAASSPDPARRMMAALRLVEDKVRYFALAMGDSGYVPAPVEQTWARKFGDCKGKATLLLTLLHGLGIDAEPVLVSSTFGDSLSVRLPLVHAFDHVIVRARIGGKSYWLDGTRTGDRDLETLASSRFVWGLPIRDGGARLEALPLAPPPAPLLESRVVYDASKGISGDLPVTGQVVFRGDTAAGLRLAYRQLGEAAFREQAAQLVRDAPAGDKTRFEFKPDEEAGTFTIAFTGTAQLDWSGTGGRISHRFDSDTISWVPDFKRSAAAEKDIPVALAFPVYLDSTETIILPKGGAGWTLTGKSFDRVVDGTRIARQIVLQDGRATAHSIFQRLKTEIGAADARAGEAALKEVNADVAGILSPEGYQHSEEERSAILASEPTTAEGFNRRGYEWMAQGEYDKALADFDKAAALSTTWSMPVANRGIALIHQRKLDEAEAALRRAEALDPGDYVVHQGYGLLRAQRGQLDEALVAFTRALTLNPDDRYSRQRRAEVYQRLRRFKEALDDLEAVAARDSKASDAWEAIALTRAEMGDEAGALAAIDKMAASMDDPIWPKLMRGDMLKRFGHKAEADRAYLEGIQLAEADKKAHPDQVRADEGQRLYALWGLGRYAEGLAGFDAEVARRKHPDVPSVLNERCWQLATHGYKLDDALSDCNKAVAAQSNAAFLDSRALVELRLGKTEAARKDYDAALALEPLHSSSLYGRGIARIRLGDKAGGEADLAAARKLDFEIDSAYKSYGVTP